MRAPLFLRPKRRQVFSDDIEKTKQNNWHLQKPLSKGEFGLTFHEQYDNTSHYFFGIFDREAITSRRKLRLLTKRAAVFVTDVVRSLPQMKPPDRDNIVYPRFENRKVVRKHVFRERDSSLSEACKIRDNYCCRVCSMTFEKTYGEFGREFAEAHHIVPLSKLRGRVERSPEDLVTVCANCHRMLHKMDGTEDDVPRLRRIVRNRKQMN